ncbi:hypothetical protein AB0J38_05450 [Streptomyces sp. NPDC050095]|uniref:hypothetical protein n=1 Tax=unclassified Streptomyces TaxID=2593676 RepID=UPI003448F24B
MSVVIKSAALSTDGGTGSLPDAAGPDDSGSIAHCVRAARSCLAQADVAPQRIGLLIHAGVYRDGNLMEPAMAALVQHQLGINPNFACDTTHPAPTVSFDVANGACGMLDAIAVAQAFLAVDPIAYALVVTADAHPGPGSPPPDFPHDACGGALLLTGGDRTGVGFGPVRTALTTTGGWAVEGYCDLSAPDAPGAVTVRTAPDAVDRIARCAASLALRTLEEAGLGTESVRLISSSSPPGLDAEVARRLGLPPDSLVSCGLPDIRAHTAAPVLGYLNARRPTPDSPPASSPEGPLLFLTAGAGPSAACTLYFPEPPV